MSISIVIPTVGRPSLQVTLGAFARDLEPEDEVIIVGDVEDTQRDVHRLVTYMGKQYAGRWVFLRGWGEGCWGQPARNRGFDIARGTHWAAIDDDDVYRPHALKAMRDAIAANPELPTIFRCTWGPGHFAHGITLWQDRFIRLGTIATPMILAPKSPCRFEVSYSGDYAYAAQLQNHFGEVAWNEQVIAEVRPAITSRDVAL